MLNTKGGLHVAHQQQELTVVKLKGAGLLRKLGCSGSNPFLTC